MGCDDVRLALEGLLAFPLTPFTSGDADGTVNVGVFTRHLEALIAEGPRALFVACGTGEFSALDLAEYRTVVQAAVAAAAGRVPVFAGTGGGPRLAGEFAACAEDCGADGLLLLPPYLVSAPASGLVHHVRFVAEATKLPLLVYQRANAILDPTSAVELLDIDNVVGIKDGRGEVDQMLRLITAIRTSGHPRAGGFGFLNGLPTAELSVRAYEAIGVHSYSSAVLCFAPEIATSFYRAVKAGDEETMDALLAGFYLPLVALRERVPGYPVALVKAGARLRGLEVGPVRPPLIEPPPEHLEQLSRILTDGLRLAETLP